jgi:cytochrome c-type biogenesis protein CcmH
MILWVIFAVMTCAALFAVWWPLSRRQNSARSGTDVAVYRDQLDEIDRDAAAALIGGVEAEAARVEISRRLIAAVEASKAASRVAAPALDRRYRWATLAVAVVLLPLGAGLTYISLGSPNLTPASMNIEASGQQLPEGIEQTVAEVEKYLEANPKNGRGWELLAPVYLRLGRFDDAVTARRNALEIFGPDAARLGDLGEAIILASNGVVIPEAKSLFERANAADPEDVMAQYYLGLSAKQDGRRDEAVQRWTTLISSARDGAEWLPMVRNALARVDDKDPTFAAPPPTAAAVAPPEHNGDAITAMVARLAERLKKDGSDVAGWIQLVRSYRALGMAEKVREAIADAHAALANDAGAMQQLNQGLAALETAVAPGVSDPAMARAAAAGPAPSAVTVAPPDHNGDAITAMVTRLAERLKKDGSDVAGWIQLVRSYRVLGMAEKVRQAVTDAHVALANDPEALQRLNQGLAALETAAAPGVSDPTMSRAAAAGPVPSAVAVAPPPGPNASQMAAAGQMAPAERNSMIEGMVARLAQRMSENGADVDGWLRLIRAYSVLGERDKALTAAANARAAVAGNSDNLRRVDELTKELGLEGS